MGQIIDTGQYHSLHTPVKRLVAIYDPDVDDVFNAMTGVNSNRYGHPIAKPGERMGFYSTPWPEQRRFQGELASKHGIHGFAMYYTWARNNTSQNLDLMLVDGYPDIPFMLIWDNAKFEFNGRDEWRLHFNWLLPFLKHRKYIHFHGKPLIMIFKAVGVPHLQSVLSTWQRLAHAAGIDALHFVQMNGEQWTPGAWELQTGIDSVAEFFPNHFPASGYAMNEVLSTKPAANSHFFGACSSVDTTPISIPNAAVIIPSHPNLLYFWLRQNLARTPPDGLVFLNAWNEWGSGLAIEPSIQWGRRWLKAVHAAVEDEKRGHHAHILEDGFVQSVPLVAAGVEMQNRGADDKVCIVVRTYRTHMTGMYNIHQLINSLLRLHHRHWAAFIVDTDIPAFSTLPDIVAMYNHGGRIRVLPLVASSYFTNGQTNDDVPYTMTDAAIRDHCMVGGFKWMLVTNGDNWYAPDALDYLPNQYDLVLMNFYTRYSVLSAIFATQSDPNGLCCARMEHAKCVVPSLILGHVDLSAILSKVEKYKHSNLSFGMFNAESARICGGLENGGCHDGVMADYMRNTGWTYAGHHSSACAVHHNANPASCEMIGGIWLDHSDPRQGGCFYATDQAIQNAFVTDNFDARYSSRTPCVC